MAFSQASQDSPIESTALGAEPFEDADGAIATRPRAVGRRLTLARRLSATLGLMAVFSTALAVLAQDRALARDLEQAAGKRLERSAGAASRLVEDALAAMGERYRAVSTTPQLRATLEIGDTPTLAFFAAELAEVQNAAAVAFLDAEDRVRAAGGDAGLVAAALHPGAAPLIGLEDRAYAAVRVPVEIGPRVVGTLLAVEPVGTSQLAGWSELCGAELRLVADPAQVAREPEALVRSVLDLGSVHLVVVSSLGEEHAAVANARQQLMTAGAAVLVLALAACVPLARGMVRPIGAIQHAVDRIRDGDLSVSIASQRNDEIGDVARGIDRMVDDLRESRQQLDERLTELAHSQQELTQAQRIARVGSLEIDLEHGALSGSPVFWSLLEMDPEDKMDGLEDLYELVHPEDRAGLRDAIRACLESGVAARLDHRVVLPDRAERVMHTQLRVERDEHDRPIRLSGTVQDVSERRRAEEQIRFLAYHDSLTGLGNRRLFKERIELAIARARRRGERLGILFLDLDHFKRVNDTLGHSVGDQMLQEVADRLVESVRQSDLIARGPDGRFDVAVSRLGGDEFTVLLDDLREPGDMAAVAERLLTTLRRPFSLGEHELVIGASIGLATWPDDGADVEALLSNADSAMYHAKANGRNDYQYYDESMNEAALHRLTLETRMRRALESGTIVAHYQPRIDLATGRLVGFEALARWRDEELGNVSPGEFIPMAEQTGLIVQLGRHVLQSVCAQARSWEDALGGFDHRFSLNVSARQFRVGNVVADVRSALEESGLNPLRLELEVTESLVLHDESRVMEALEELREMGISIALDDFGTGYSSLSYLRRLPVDTLKIDMSFVRAIARSSQDSALTQAIVAMGRALGLRVVAEGVETTEQRRLLAGWGCHEMQGFLVSPAEPVERAFERLRAEASEA